MPAATTHVEFGTDLINALPPSLRQKVTDIPMFWIGTQGPDILFFSRMSVIPGSLHKYGNLLHEKKIKEQFTFLVQYVENHPHMTSYLLGYITHYALDSKAHRLICSMAQHAHDTSGWPKGPVHVRMESEIDAWIVNQKGRRVHKDIWKAMRLTAENRKRLAILYTDLFENVYDIHIPAERFEHALLELNVWTPIIRPHYLGESITLGAEFFLGSPRNAKNMILHPLDDKQCLNTAHTEYPCFYDDSQTISKSFEELYEEALLLGYKMIKDFQPDLLDRNFMGEPFAIKHNHEKGRRL